MEVGSVYVSKSDDPTNLDAVVHNFTTFVQDVSSPGRVRLNFEAEQVCESCTLHVVSLVSPLSSPLSSRVRRLSAPNQADVAITSIPMTFWSPESPGSTDQHKIEPPDNINSARGLGRAKWWVAMVLGLIT